MEKTIAKCMYENQIFSASDYSPIIQIGEEGHKACMTFVLKVKRHYSCDYLTNVKTVHC